MATSVTPVSSYGAGPVPAEFRGLKRDTFFFEIDFNPLAANANAVPGNLTVDSDAHFLITGGAMVATSAADQTTRLALAPVTISMKRTGAGRDLQSGPVHAENIFGTGQRPAIWQAPALIRANSTLTVAMSNLGAVALIVRLTFIGYKLFLE